MEMWFLGIFAFPTWASPLSRCMSWQLPAAPYSSDLSINIMADKKDHSLWGRGCRVGLLYLSSKSPLLVLLSTPQIAKMLHSQEINYPMDVAQSLLAELG